MKSKIVEDADVVTYVMVCDPGEEAFGALQRLAREENLEAAHLSGLGGFESATVGWFDREKKDFRRIEVEARPLLPPDKSRSASSQARGDKPIWAQHSGKA
ncbi:DUF296 domain-containing protein, partial [Asanoa sp. NPDC050611]|uniref:PCC domain-containing protein n=1 Tax=Asanoa sp. NPDC050611 TaxID=3157098 RepID=UPI0033EB5BFC